MASSMPELPAGPDPTAGLTQPVVPVTDQARAQAPLAALPPLSSLDTRSLRREVTAAVKAAVLRSLQLEGQAPVTNVSPGYVANP